MVKSSSTQAAAWRSTFGCCFPSWARERPVIVTATDSPAAKPGVMAAGLERSRSWWTLIDRGTPVGPRLIDAWKSVSSKEQVARGHCIPQKRALAYKL